MIEPKIRPGGMRMIVMAIVIATTNGTPAEIADTTVMMKTGISGIVAMNQNTATRELTGMYSSTGTATDVASFFFYKFRSTFIKAFFGRLFLWNG